MFSIETVVPRISISILDILVKGMSSKDDFVVDIEYMKKVYHSEWDENERIVYQIPLSLGSTKGNILKFRLKKNSKKKNTKGEVKFDISDFTIRNFLNGYFVRKFKSSNIFDSSKKVVFNFSIHNAGDHPEDEYPFYCLFCPSYQFSPLVSIVLSFLPLLDVIRMRLVSKNICNIIRSKHIIPLLKINPEIVSLNINSVNETEIKVGVVEEVEITEDEIMSNADPKHSLLQLPPKNNRDNFFFWNVFQSIFHRVDGIVLHPDLIYSASSLTSENFMFDDLPLCLRNLKILRISGTRDNNNISLDINSSPISSLINNISITDIVRLINLFPHLHEFSTRFGCFAKERTVNIGDKRICDSTVVRQLTEEHKNLKIIIIQILPRRTRIRKLEIQEMARFTLEALLNCPRLIALELPVLKFSCHSFLNPSENIEDVLRQKYFSLKFQSVGLKNTDSNKNNKIKINDEKDNVIMLKKDVTRQISRKKDIYFLHPHKSLGVRISLEFFDRITIKNNKVFQGRELLIEGLYTKIRGYFNLTKRIILLEITTSQFVFVRWKFLFRGHLNFQSFPKSSSSSSLKKIISKSPSDKVQKLDDDDVKNRDDDEVLSSDDDNDDLLENILDIQKMIEMYYYYDDDQNKEGGGNKKSRKDERVIKVFTPNQKHTLYCRLPTTRNNNNNKKNPKNNEQDQENEIKSEEDLIIKVMGESGIVEFFESEDLFKRRIQSIRQYVRRRRRNNHRSDTPEKQKIKFENLLIHEKSLWGSTDSISFSSTSSSSSSSSNEDSENGNVVDNNTRIESITYGESEEIRGFPNFKSRKTQFRMFDEKLIFEINHIFPTTKKKGWRHSIFLRRVFPGEFVIPVRFSITLNVKSRNNYSEEVVDDVKSRKITLESSQQLFCPRNNGWGFTDIIIMEHNEKMLSQKNSKEEEGKGEEELSLEELLFDPDKGIIQSYEVKLSIGERIVSYKEWKDTSYSFYKSVLKKSISESSPLKEEKEVHFVIPNVYSSVQNGMVRIKKNDVPEVKQSEETNDNSIILEENEEVEEDDNSSSVLDLCGIQFSVEFFPLGRSKILDRENIKNPNSDEEQRKGELRCGIALFHQFSNNLVLGGKFSIRQLSAKKKKEQMVNRKSRETIVDDICEVEPGRKEWRFLISLTLTNLEWKKN